MKEKEICKNCGKEKIIHARELCKSCYDKLLYKGMIEGVNLPKCQVVGCERFVRANGYCQRHYSQIWKYGKISDSNLNRTRFDRNEIIIKDNYAEMILYNDKCFEKARTLIDIEDIDKLKEYKWTCGNDDLHIRTTVNGQNLMIHRFIMNCTDDNLVVDHINRNPLDNRKKNLRICTPQENVMNGSLSSTNTTGIIGLYYNEKRNIWQPNITVNQKVIVLGEYSNKDDAIKERLKAEVYYFKEFAPQKHLYEQYGIDENAQYKVKEYKPRKKGNPYGIKGVFKGSGTNKGRWKVEFKKNNKHIFLGVYDTLEEAIKVRQSYKE